MKHFEGTFAPFITFVSENLTKKKARKKKKKEPQTVSEFGIGKSRTKALYMQLMYPSRIFGAITILLLQYRKSNFDNNFTRVVQKFPKA